MSIYTGRGDEGETSLANGERVDKTSVRVEAYGTIDEAESFVGLARTASDEQELCEVLDFVQQRLMNCASNLATPSEDVTERTPKVTAEDVMVLEAAIDRFIDGAGEIDHFIVPQGDDVSARLHVARSVMRRAERRVVALARESHVDPQVMCFINRTSDLLYAAARWSASRHGRADEKWDPSIPTPDL